MNTADSLTTDSQSKSFPKLNPELKAKWLDALRSGKYQQGRQCLRSDEGCYCCLGVLADLIDQMQWSRHDDAWHWQAQFHEPEYEDEDGCWENDRSEKLPPATLDEAVQDALWHMNDGEKEVRDWDNVLVIKEAVPGKSFAEIADSIETNL